jgi:multimeric flavodoxin WrbA
MPTAALLNCTLKPSPDESSTDALLDLFEGELAAAGCTSTRVRLADHDIKPGVSHDEGDGDEWPDVEQQLMQADVIVVGTPIWLGQPSSVVKRALERLDAFISETDDRGQMPPVDKVALVAVVGNEDGAHHVGAELYQGLADIGFTIPANGMAYWVGEAMGSTDFKDLDEPPEKVRSTVKTAVANATHLAEALQADPYPSVG